MEYAELTKMQESLSQVQNDCGDAIKMHRAKSAIKRMQILRALELKERMNMSELGRALVLKASTVSRHVKELLNANLVNVERQGQNSYVTKKEVNNLSGSDG